MFQYQSKSCSKSFGSLDISPNANSFSKQSHVQAKFKSITFSYHSSSTVYSVPVAKKE